VYVQFFGDLLPASAWIAISGPIPDLPLEALLGAWRMIQPGMVFSPLLVACHKYTLSTNALPQAHGSGRACPAIAQTNERSAA